MTQDLNEKVYEPMRQLKQKFYDSKTQDEWDGLKEELKSLLNTAKESMDTEFYEKYSKGVIDSIAKMRAFKERQFNKTKFTPQPKQSYIFRPEEGESFIKLANALAEFFTNKIKSYEIQ